MDYKEKYEHALERASKLRGQNPFDNVEQMVESIFPELKKSDENVREDIISLVNEFWDRIGSINPEYTSRSRMIAWLEKQDKPNPYSGTSFEYDGHIWDMRARDNGVEIIFDGERKAFLSLEKSFIFPIYPQPSIIPKSAQETINGAKVEPKFKVGDWIVQAKIGVYKVIEICESWYEVVDNKDKHYSIGFDKEYMCHLWTINDAKDGDVLVCNINKAEIGGDVEKLPNMTPTICIYQNVVKDSDYIHSYCSLYDENSLVLQNKMYYNTFVYNIYPATKEQHELLFQTMKEYGYEWDSEKKEPKKIEITSKDSEDEKIRKQLITHFRNTRCVTEEGAETIIKWMSWLEKQGEQKPETWCTEDEQNLNAVLSFISDECLRRWLKDKLCYDMKYILPYDVSRQVYQIACDCGKTFEQSFALLAATHKGYQRGLKDAGYEYDAEKQELSKIADKSSLSEDD